LQFHYSRLYLDHQLLPISLPTVSPAPSGSIATARLTSIDRFAVGYASIRQKDGHYEYVPVKAYWSHGGAGGRLLDHQRTCPDFASGCAHTTALDFARLMLMLMLMLMNGGALDGKRILRLSGDSPTAICGQLDMFVHWTEIAHALGYHDQM
jgi:hypothetical protein